MSGPQRLRGTPIAVTVRLIVGAAVTLVAAPGPTALVAPRRTPT